MIWRGFGDENGANQLTTWPNATLPLPVVFDSPICKPWGAIEDAGVVYLMGGCDATTGDAARHVEPNKRAIKSEGTGT